MGWISDRHMRQGGSIGPGGLSARKKGAPLRRVIAIKHLSMNLFLPNRVLLECGHTGESWGGARARCPECRKPV